MLFVVSRYLCILLVRLLPLGEKIHIYKDRVNPFEDYDDDEFRKRFRLSKLVVDRVHEQQVKSQPSWQQTSSNVAWI